MRLFWREMRALDDVRPADGPLRIRESFRPEQPKSITHRLILGIILSSFQCSFPILLVANHEAPFFMKRIERIGLDNKIRVLSPVFLIMLQLVAGEIE